MSEVLQHYDHDLLLAAKQRRTGAACSIMECSVYDACKLAGLVQQACQNLTPPRSQCSPIL